MNVNTKYGYVKPCPICGSHVAHGWRKDLFHDHIQWFDSGAVERPAVVWCTTCRCSMSGADLRDAINRWNDRTKYSHRK